VPQVTVQLTPEFELSLVTVATKLPVALTRSVVVAGVTLTAIAPVPPPPPEPLAVISIDADADWLGSVTEVAVTVTTGEGVGTAEGAVKTVLAPLRVFAGLTAPQAPAVPQLTLQVTPALAGSLMTVAVKVAVPLSTTEVADWLSVTVTAPATEVTVIVAEAVLLGSVTELAVMVTVPPAGTVAGAM
jgi:hypothetical protein